MLNSVVCLCWSELGYVALCCAMLGQSWAMLISVVWPCWPMLGYVESILGSVVELCWPMLAYVGLC